MGENDLRMTEQCFKTNGKKLPATHNRGKIAVDDCFATSGAECLAASILPKYGGVGDHRCFFLDFTSDSIIGTFFPKIAKPSSRKLHCESSRLVRNYNKVLNQLADRHQLFRKLNML